MTPDHPLLAPWPGPNDGLPPFGAFEVADLAPALRTAMEAYRAEVATIAESPEPPTFANTVEALEASGRTLDRVIAVYHLVQMNLSSPEARELAQEMAPELAALTDQITFHPGLYERIDAVWQGREPAGLTGEAARLTWRVRESFARRGAALDGPARTRLEAIHRELATLYTGFSQNLLADEETFTHLPDPADLEGLPDDLAASARAAARERDLSGGVILNTRSMVEPFLTRSPRRDLREAVWRRFASRGDNGDENDNNAIITRILALRRERADLLGYESHAHWRLADSMARTPEAALALLRTVWEAAVARLDDELADQRILADRAGHALAPWDVRFYQEEVRKARFDLDDDVIKPYLQLDRLRDGLFWVAGELHGLRFEPLDAPLHHPDARAWTVRRQAGATVGTFVLDPYARSGKRSGAWMVAWRSQSRFRGEVLPIITNTCNFVKGADGEPTLLSWSDARTLFHEFGHALHGLLSDVDYPTLAGTAVARDFVELPSQLNERWLATRPVLERFARHRDTDEPLPEEIIERLEAAATFGEGFRTVEYLACALLDLEAHLAATPPTDLGAFEREALDRLGMPAEVVMRHRLPHFMHLFAGDGYSAGYYSYLWADTLVADAAEAFHEAGSLYDRVTADRLRETILSVGNTVDAAEAFRAFRGRDPDVGALMRDRGFAAT
jgi:peptidyl-dipeptidase Dcp